MLLGAYEHTLDDKNRLTLPAKFREAFSSGVVLTKGIEECLEAHGREVWQHTIAERLAGLDPLSGEARRLKRYVFAGGNDVELDKQGRLVISPSLLEHGKLSREVIIAGVYDHLEIWDRAAWREHLRTVEGSANDVAERLAAKRD